MNTDAQNLQTLFLDSSLSDFFAETDLFYVDFSAKKSHGCSTLKSLGYGDDDLPKMLTNFPVVEQEEKERADILLRRVMENETDNILDTFHISSKDGKELRWLRISARVVSRDANMQPEVLVGHVVDVDDLITSQEEIRERLVEINAMRELFTAINKSLDFNETFQRVIEQLKKIIPFQRASAEALEDDSLVIVETYGFTESDIRGLVFPLHGVDSPSSRVVQERRTIFCNDVPNNFVGFINTSDNFVTMSWLGIPLIYEQKVLGILALDNSAPNAYTERHIQLASSLAEYIAIAFEHSRRHQLVKHQAMTDKLTGLANRYGLGTSGIEIFQNSIERDQFFSVLMIDIDHFKQINDTYGHSYGDAVLQSIAMTIRGQIRSNDYAVRYGGEEFVVLLPELSTREALIVAERLRIKISQMKIDKERKFPTVSIGIYAAVPGTMDILHEFIRKADLALYTAKESGRNRSRVWSTNPEFFAN